jgi:hypothetical protein
VVGEFEVGFEAGAQRKALRVRRFSLVGTGYREP